MLDIGSGLLKIRAVLGLNFEIYVGYIILISSGILNLWYVENTKR